MSRHCTRNCDVLVNEYAKNRQMFLAVLQNKQFLTRQGLEIRGNKGQENFDPATKLSSKTDPRISWWINQKVDRKKKKKKNETGIYIVIHKTKFLSEWRLLC